MAFYQVENQWGGDYAPWHDGGTWKLGRQSDQVVAIKLESNDDGQTLTGSVSYAGGGSIPQLELKSHATPSSPNLYTLTTPPSNDNQWMIGARSNQNVVQLKLQSSDGGQTLTGTMTYAHEGPIGFRGKILKDTPPGKPTDPLFTDQYYDSKDWTLGNQNIYSLVLENEVDQRLLEIMSLLAQENGLERLTQFDLKGAITAITAYTYNVKKQANQNPSGMRATGLATQVELYLSLLGLLMKYQLARDPKGRSDLRESAKRNTIATISTVPTLFNQLPLPNKILGGETPCSTIDEWQADLNSALNDSNYNAVRQSVNLAVKTALKTLSKASATPPADQAAKADQPSMQALQIEDFHDQILSYISLLQKLKNWEGYAGTDATKQTEELTTTIDEWAEKVGGVLDGLDSWMGQPGWQVEASQNLPLQPKSSSIWQFQRLTTLRLRLKTLKGLFERLVNDKNAQGDKIFTLIPALLVKDDAELLAARKEDDADGDILTFGLTLAATLLPTPPTTIKTSGDLILTDRNTSQDLSEMDSLPACGGFSPATPENLVFVPIYISKQETMQKLAEFRDAPGKVYYQGLETQVDLTDVTGSTGFTLDIPNQNELRVGQNSCTAHAAVGLMTYFERWSDSSEPANSSGSATYSDRKPSRVNFSSRFLYYVTRQLARQHSDDPLVDQGASLRDTMKALALFGTPPEEHWPWPKDAPESEPSQFCYTYAAKFRAANYFRLDRPAGGNRKHALSPEALLAQIKVVLMAKFPIMFGFWYSPDVLRQVDSEGTIPYRPATSTDKGHAVIAVGYDDTRGAIKIRNCWGKEWGKEGYGWLPYDYVLQQQTTSWWSLIKADWVDKGKFGLEHPFGTGWQRGDVRSKENSGNKGSKKNSGDVGSKKNSGDVGSKKNKSI